MSFTHKDKSQKWLEAERDAMRLSLDMVSCAIASTEFMDRPGGGYVRLDEQVSRMREALVKARLEVQALRGACEDLRSQRASTLEALRTESARLDWLLGSYRARQSILNSGVLDIDYVSAFGARAAIDEQMDLAARRKS